MTTYTIKVDSCEAKPKIVTEFEGVPEARLKRVLYVATRAFRNVEAVCDETGEIECSYYESCHMHCPSFNYGEAIDMMCHEAYDKE